MVEVALSEPDISCETLWRQIDSIEAQGNTAFFQFKHQNTAHKIAVRLFRNGPGYQGRRQLLQVSTDSVLKGTHFSIDALLPQMTKQYSNEGRDPEYSESPNEVVIQTTFHTHQSSLEVKQLLKRVLDAFIAIEGATRHDLSLHIAFDCFEYALPKPPHPLWPCKRFFPITYSTIGHVLTQPGPHRLSELFDSIGIRYDTSAFENITIETTALEEDIFYYEISVSNGAASAVAYSSRGGEGFAAYTESRLCMENPNILMVKKHQYDVTEGADSNYTMVTLGVDTLVEERYLGRSKYENSLLVTDKK